MHKARLTVNNTNLPLMVGCSAAAGLNAGTVSRMDTAASKHYGTYMFWLGFWLGAIGLEIYRANRAARKTEEYARVENAIKYLRERAGRTGK